MSDSSKPEVWLRGPLPDITPLLQPIAHALLQAREELNVSMIDFPADKLWERPAGVASVGFHLQHLTGVLDRLFTYAREESLTAAQLAYLSAEGKENETISVEHLLVAFNNQVGYALSQLKITDEANLTEFRAVGRAKLPSTVIGLLMHAAEHTTRHLGQLLVTIKVLKAKAPI